MDHAGPIRNALDAEAVDLVRDAVEEVPRQMRHCATLRLFQGLSYREVAATLRISVDSVKIQLFRARQRIRSRLREYVEEPVRGER